MEEMGGDDLAASPAQPDPEILMLQEMLDIQTAVLDSLHDITELGDQDPSIQAATAEIRYLKEQLAAARAGLGQFEESSEGRSRHSPPSLLSSASLTFEQLVTLPRRPV